MSLSLSAVSDDDLSEERVLVLDTETLDLPQRMGFNVFYPYHMLPMYENARILEVACAFYNNHGKLLETWDCFIQTRGR